MTRAEYIASQKTENTGIKWLPIGLEDLCEGYVISEKGQIYSLKSGKIIKKRMYKGCTKEYAELYKTGSSKRTSFNVETLMLATFG